jgi:radical SAM family uncharacterized protein
MDSIRKTLTEKVLRLVETPGQYIGRETNIVVKDHGAVDVKVLLAFPDTYALGMSHLGLHILYAILNAHPKIAAERAYAPWPDMAAKMRAEKVPLYSLETFTPARDFDIVGFSLQYEMGYTNVLEMLDLAGIPLLASERGPGDPLVIAGGPCVFSPEPMADFIDLFVIGDGEEVLLSLVEAYRDLKAGGASSRQQMIAGLVAQVDNLRNKKVPGLYAPSLYEDHYKPDGTLEFLRPIKAGAPAVVEAARVADLNLAAFPSAPLVPLVQAIHERIALEIMRGCTQGCRFCQAGMTKRPTRLRSPETLFEQARKAYAATGHSEISLTSLSTSDYPELSELLGRLSREFTPKGVSLSVPSLRVGEQLSALPEALSEVRKSGLTIAPEAARQDLRRVINKNIADDELFNGVIAAYEAGWQLVKLYFMVGLPTETDEDVEAIPALAYKVSNLRKTLGKPPASVNVAVAPFVPKSHTPFQWEAMATIERLREIDRRLKEKMRRGRVRLKMHRVERSFLEGVFSRGDRRLGRVLLAAWRKGCRFDAWDEHFRFAAWQEAFQEAGLDPAFYANRRRGDDETLPWSHISCGVSVDFLREERERAYRREVTLDCRLHGCRACGTFPCRSV